MAAVRRRCQRCGARLPARKRRLCSPCGAVLDVEADRRYRLRKANPGLATGVPWAGAPNRPVEGQPRGGRKIAGRPPAHKRGGS